MKKDKQPSEEMRPEYRREDLGMGVRGKYAKVYKGTFPRTSNSKAHAFSEMKRNEEQG